MRTLLAAAALAGLSAVSLADDPKPKADPPKPKKPEPTLKVGDPAPPLKATKWLQGAEVKQFETGKTYVVEFWATWCGPCIVMMPHMAEMQAEYRDKGVTFIGFTAKDGNNTQEKVSAFVEKRGPKLGYTFAFADDRETYDAWMKAAQQNGIPCSYVVGKDGKIAYIGHPMFLGAVLPKAAAGTWTADDVANMKAVEKDVDGVFEAIDGADAAAGLKTLADFEAKYPGMTGIPYFTAPKLAALLKLKKYDEAKTAATAVVNKAVHQGDPIALQKVSAAMRSPDAKSRKDLLAVSTQAADALVAVNGDQDVNALMNAAAAYKAAGDPATAIGYGKKALPLAEKEIKGDQDATGLLRAADVSAAAGDQAKATEYARKAIPIVEKALRGDKDAIGLLRVADAYLAAGEKAKAKEFAQKAVAASASNPNLKMYVEAQVKKFDDEKTSDQP